MIWKNWCKFKTPFFDSRCQLNNRFEQADRNYFTNDPARTRVKMSNLWIVFGCLGLQVICLRISLDHSWKKRSVNSKLV